MFVFKLWLCKYDKERFSLWNSRAARPRFLLYVSKSHCRVQLDLLNSLCSDGTNENIRTSWNRTASERWELKYRTYHFLYVLTANETSRDGLRLILDNGSWIMSRGAAHFSLLSELFVSLQTTAQRNRKMLVKSPHSLEGKLRGGCLHCHHVWGVPPHSLFTPNRPSNKKQK